MPIYEYMREDGTVFECWQRMSDEVLTVCPTTNQTVKRLISLNAFHLKGTGWYKTDYANKSGPEKGSGVQKSSTGTQESTGNADSSGPTGGATGSSSTEGAVSGGACKTGCGCH